MRYIQVHSRIEYVLPGWCISRTFWIIFFGLSSTALSRLIGEAASLPNGYPYVFITVGNYPVIFIFTRCVFWYLGYSLFLSSQPFPICTISWGFRSILEGPIGALLRTSCLGVFQGIWCIQTYPHPISSSFLMGFLFWPRVCTELLGGGWLFLRASAIIGRDPKFLSI